VCILAIAVAAPLALTHSRNGPAPAPTTTSARTPAFPHALPAPAPGRSPDLTFGFTVDPVDGYHFTPTVIAADFQRGQMSNNSHRIGYTVTVYYRGRFDPSTLDTSDPVRVGGRTGYYATMLGTPALAWEYADNGWAVVSVIFPLPLIKTIKATELDIAEAAHAAQQTTRVPFRLEHAAAGDYVTNILLPDNTEQVGGDLGSVDIHDAGTGGTWTFAWTQHTLGPGAPHPTVINGRTWTVNVDTGRVQGVTKYIGIPGTGAVLLQHAFGFLITHLSSTKANDTVPRNVMSSLMSNITFASDPSNPNTWFDPTSALRR
jgi:hypothetical protein